MKRSFVADCSGDNYLYGGKAINRRSPSVSSYRCTDCGTVRYTTKIEWCRAKTPRCLRCGGPLDETKATVKKIRKRSK